MGDVFVGTLENTFFNCSPRNVLKNAQCKFEILYSRPTKMFRWEVGFPHPSQKGRRQFHPNRGSGHLCYWEPQKDIKRVFHSEPISPEHVGGKTTACKCCVFEAYSRLEILNAAPRAAARPWKLSWKRAPNSVASTNLLSHQSALETLLSTLIT